MFTSRISALLGTDVVPNPSPKVIGGLMDKINDLLGNAQWIGIICGVLALIIAGGLITFNNHHGPGAGGGAVEKVGWAIVGVLIVVSAPMIIRQFV